VYREQGRYTDAEGLSKRSLAIFEKVLSAEHPYVAASLNSLAEVYRKQGKYADADGLFKRVVVIREKALGADHPDVADTFNNLAILSASSGNASHHFWAGATWPQAQQVFAAGLEHIDYWHL